MSTTLPSRKPLASMTGYAHARVEREGGALEVELRSVNHRYLEPTFRLPDELRHIETRLRDRLGGRLARGKLECRVSWTRHLGLARLASPEPAILAALAKVQSAVRATLPDAAPLTVSDVLSFAQGLESGEDGETLAEEALTVFERALEDLTRHRAREAAKLAEALRERIAAIRALRAGLGPQVPQLVEAFRVKLADKIAEAAREPMNDRLSAEVVLFASRIDIAEELTRLDAHCEEVERVLADGGVCGKRLDFLMQELNREANTLGSKAASNALSKAAVDMKVLIEQMREQVQNIE